jgi:PAS domain S-box-containing protein
MKTQLSELQRQALHLAAVVASSDDAIVTKDLDGVVQSWNPAAERLFGFTAEEMIGQSIRKIIPRERLSEEDDVLRRVRAGDPVDHFETIRQRKDGGRVPISLTVSPIRDLDGEVIGASKIARDISDRVLLQGERNRLAAIVDSSDDAIISKDLNGIVKSWNRGAEIMFGYTAAEAIGRPITMIVPDDRLSEEYSVLSRVRQGLNVEHYETLRRRKDGSLIPISLSVSPIRDGTGTIVGASKIARDLSALRAYATTLEQTVRERTAALEAANAQLEAFAYSVSHDLRAPLRGMHGLAKILLDDYAARLDDRGQDYANRIVSEAALLDRLIQDLLAYSRLTRVDVALEEVSGGEAVEAAVRSLHHDIITTHATIQIDPDLPTFRANRAVLVQVLTNLISNAIKFSGNHPRIRVRADREHGPTRLWIEDSGIGIDPKHHERIFRAFERLHTNETYAGTGIGLAIVRRGVERLGGRVGVESAIGVGSRFWIELQEVKAG